MTFGEKLRTALLRDADVAGVLNSRVFPMVLPSDCTLPAIAYTVVSDVPVSSLDASGGTRHARIQIDCYAVKYLDAQVLADAVAGALGNVVSTGFTSEQLSRRDRYEADRKLYGVSMDFSMWMTEA